MLNLWHKLLTQMSLDAIEKYLQTGKTAIFFLKEKFPFPPFVCGTAFFLAGGAAPAPRRVAAQWGETIALDLQSGSCVHCQLFPARSNGGSAGACEQPLETPPTEADRATCLHFLNWAN